MNSRDKVIDTFQRNVERELTRLALCSGSRGHVFNDNLSSEERTAIESLSRDSAIVIWNSDRRVWL